MEKKDNNEDEGRVKRKDEYPPRRMRVETGTGDGRAKGPRRMKEWKKKKKEKPRLVIWIESTIHSNPRVLLAVDPPLHFSPFAKIWILLDLSGP